MKLLDTEKTRLIYEQLRKKYPNGAYAFLENVRNSTGYDTRDGIRTCDALCLSLWPSRGLSITGFEIKASRGDWLKEYEHPEKADAIQKYCDYWYLVTYEEEEQLPLVRDGELPEMWGHIELKNSKLFYKKISPKLEPLPMSKNMLCGLMRNVTENYFTKEYLNNKTEEARKLGDMSMKHNLERLKEKVEKFEKASGINLEDEWDMENIGEAVKLVKAGAHKGVRDSLKYYKEFLQREMRDIDEVLQNDPVLKVNTLNKKP